MDHEHEHLQETTVDTGKWGMVIDQDICTGCQACVAACAMENNLSFVGEEDVAYGRSMQWIRIERFWQGEYPNVSATDFQPLRRHTLLCKQLPLPGARFQLA